MRNGHVLECGAAAPLWITYRTRFHIPNPTADNADKDKCNMNDSFRILAADHTGITVSDLERSLAFWRDVLGFELSHRTQQSGTLAGEITGVPGAALSLAVVKAPG